MVWRPSRTPVRHLVCLRAECIGFSKGFARSHSSISIFAIVDYPFRHVGAEKVCFSNGSHAFPFCTLPGVSGAGKFIMSTHVEFGVGATP